MLDYKKLDKEIDVVLKSFTKEDLSLWLKLKLERENLEKDMKDFPLKNIIDEWLAKNGNPEIDKQVELEAKLLAEFEMLEGMKTTINIEGKEFTIEQLKELINKNEDKLEAVFNFNKTTEEQFNKKWEGFEEHEKYGALERLIVNFYNKGEKPNWENTKQYKYYPYFIMYKDDFRYYSYHYDSTHSRVSSRLSYLRKEDMLEAVELYLDIYKKSRL